MLKHARKIWACLRALIHANADGRICVVWFVGDLAQPSLLETARRQAARQSGIRVHLVLVPSLTMKLSCAGWLRAFLETIGLPPAILGVHRLYADSTIGAW
jgi:hypothetical protein